VRSSELLRIGSLVEGASFLLVLVFGLVFAGSLLSEDLVLEGVLLVGAVVSLEEFALSTLKNFLCGTSFVVVADSLTGLVLLFEASAAVPERSMNLELPLSVAVSTCLSLLFTPATTEPVLGSRAGEVFLMVERWVVLTAPLLLGP
jgi:hypothetical protein